MKLTDFSQYKVVRERAATIIRFLGTQEDYTVYDRSGFATATIRKALPEHLQVGAAMADTLNRMRDAGWVHLDRSGKKTFTIKLIAYPDDWAFPESPQEPSPVPESTPADDELPEPSDDLSAVELGGRAGRIAARLEKHIDDKITGLEGVASNLPAMIQDGIQVAILNLVAQVVGVPDTDETLRMAAEAEAEHADELTRELAAERLSHQNTREELNRLRRAHDTVAKQGSNLSPNDLPESHRQIGKWAVENGWSLQRSAGGHNIFRSPEGRPYFASATPSDYRGTKNMLADLYRMGLPRMES